MTAAEPIDWDDMDMAQWLRLTQAERNAAPEHTRARLRAELDAREAAAMAEIEPVYEVDYVGSAEFGSGNGYEPPVWDDPDQDDGLDGGPCSWDPVDIAKALDEPPAQPELLRFDDWVAALVYRCRTHTFYGPSESGKSWVALITAKQELENGGRVLIIDYEDNAAGIAERLRLLGTDPDLLRDQDWFRYVNPTEPVGPDRQGRFGPGAAALTDLVDWQPDLVIIDGVTEALAYEGLSEMSATDFAAWLKLIARRFDNVGAAVIMIDHTAKSVTDAGPSELGTQHKRGGLTGASFFVDAIRRPGRATGAEPINGLLRLRLAKDRVGWLRGRHPGRLPVVADIELISWPDGGITYHVLPGGQSETDGTDELAIEIVNYLLVSGGRPDEQGESRSAIAVGIGRDRSDRNVGAKLTEMLTAEHLTFEPGPNRSKLHRLTEAGINYYNNADDEAES